MINVKFSEVCDVIAQDIHKRMSGNYSDTFLGTISRGIKIEKSYANSFLSSPASQHRDGKPTRLVSNITVLGFRRVLMQGNVVRLSVHFDGGKALGVIYLFL